MRGLQGNGQGRSDRSPTRPKPDADLVDANAASAPLVPCFRRKMCSKMWSKISPQGGASPEKTLVFKMLPSPARVKVAERQGFEPWVGLHPQRFSRPPRSTTPAPLRGGLGGPSNGIFPPVQEAFCIARARKCPNFRSTPPKRQAIQGQNRAEGPV